VDDLWLQIAGWAVSIVAIIGVVLNNRMNRACFILWMFSNSATLLLHLRAAMYGLAARDAVFLVLAVWGWRAWKKRTT
jgi:nicotinamide riboside transporter PnuC